MTEIVGMLLIAAAGLFALVVLALAIVAVVLALEVRRLGPYVSDLEDSRERWQQAFYAQRDHFHQMRADAAEEASWFDEIESYANGAGEAS